MTRLTPLLYGLMLCLIAAGAPAQAAPQQIQVQTTFSCSNQDECKRKCEAIGGRWKKDQTGTTHGTCSLPKNVNEVSGVIEPNPPSAVDIGHLAELANQDRALLAAATSCLTDVADKQGVSNAEVVGLSIQVNGRASNSDVCATCLGAGFSTAICCSPKVANCNDPCRDGDYIPFGLKHLMERGAPLKVSAK